MRDQASRGRDVWLAGWAFALISQQTRQTSSSGKAIEMQTSNTDSESDSAEYRAATRSAGFARQAGATLIEISGSDRASFLHNLCTNNITGLAPGEGCELFLTDVQGKTIGHGFALVGSRSIVLATVPQQAEKLLLHLDRYLIREDVQLADRTGVWQQWLLVGPQAEEACRICLETNIPPRPFDHLECGFGNKSVHLSRTDFYGACGFLLQCDAADDASLSKSLHNVATECGPQTMETLRIEAGTPAYDVDITVNNFPQEIGRDARALSFTKGCYLGQETVARIDALGHVNRQLCRLRFLDAGVPQVDMALEDGGQSVGQVTSAVYSPQHGCPLAFALLKRGHTQAGKQLESEVGPAEVL